MSDPGIFPYSPITPPDDVNPALARWAFRELQDVSDALALRPDPLAILMGIPAPLAVSARTIITGYPTHYEGEGFRNATDPPLGAITLPFTGLYEIFGHAAGTYTANIQNEAAVMFLRTPGGDLDFAGWPIATNKIQFAAFNGSFLLAGNEGDVWSLGLYATVSLGTFTFTSTQFAVRLSTV